MRASWPQPSARAWAHLMTGCPIPASTIPALALARHAIQPALPSMVLSRIRLSLIAADFATAIDPAQEHLLAQVADDVLQDEGVHAAREILDHPAAASFLSQAQRQRLRGIKAAAGLGPGQSPDPSEANWWQEHPQPRRSSARLSSAVPASRR